MKKIIFILSLSFFAFAIKAQTPTMVLVQGGIFPMGLGSTSSGDEGLIHNVTVSSFSMGKYEVTVAEYKTFCTASGRIMPDAPSWGGWIDNHPIVKVSWDDAVAYCDWMSNKTGKNYRLPTEAEWEFAARGGNNSRAYPYAGSDGLEEVGWSRDNADGQTQACGRKKANELGLYDMSGNAKEWCNDWYSDSYYRDSPSTNPKGPSSGYERVLRGGSWSNFDFICLVSRRSSGDPDERNSRHGFRVVLSQ